MGIHFGGILVCVFDRLTIQSASRLQFWFLPTGCPQKDPLMNITRRRALHLGSAAVAALAAKQVPAFTTAASEDSNWLKISLQQYSFKSMLTGKQPALKTIDYPKFAVD